MITFNNIDEMKEFYNKETNTFCIDDDICINFRFICDCHIIARNITAKNITAKNIDACNINAGNIVAGNIYAWDINACDINAKNIIVSNIDAGNINACDIDANDIIANNITAKTISYCAFCCAYESIRCDSIIGYRVNCRVVVLDGELVVKGDIKNEKN